jgi:PAS domain S-box-containing protein
MALAVQRAELNDLLEQMLDGIQQISPDRTIRWANRAVLEMLGYSAQAYVGHRLSEFFVDQAAFESWFSRLQQGEIIVDLPVTMRARDGSERFVRLYAVPNAKLQGAPETYRVYTRDVTGRLHMEQTLRDRNRELHKAVAARDEFLSVAAHELKTPATTLRAYTQLLLRDLRRQREISPSRLETSLAAIEAQSKKLDHLVSRLLDSGQIDEGRLRMVPVVTDVAALLRSVAESQRLTMHRTIEVHAPDVLHVLIDPVRFEQVMTNLVNNAIKFSPEGGRIELALTLESNGSLRFTVTDEGIGVPDSELAAIFSRFYQGISASHLSGLGLGLYITREIVKLHGGDIAVEHPDHPGARFVVTLPASVVLPAGGPGIAEDT